MAYVDHSHSSSGTSRRPLGSDATMIGIVDKYPPKDLESWYQQPYVCPDTGSKHRLWVTTMGVKPLEGRTPVSAPQLTESSGLRRSYNSGMGAPFDGNGSAGRINSGRWKRRGRCIRPGYTQEARGSGKVNLTADLEETASDSICAKKRHHGERGGYPRRSVV